MPRAVKEWIGKTDDSPPSTACKLRVLDRQEHRCAITGLEFRPGDVIEFDHCVPLWLGGKNAEGNLQAVLGTAHAGKSKAEAMVRAKMKARKEKHFGLKASARKRLRGRPFPPSSKPKRDAPRPPRRMYALWQPHGGEDVGD